MSRRPLPWILGGALALLSACGTLSPLELVDGEGCTADTDCKGERICVEGSCLYPDEVGRPLDGGVLPDGGEPDDGGTVPDAGELHDGGMPPPPTDDGGTPPEDGAVGAPCESFVDCEAGAACLSDWPEGYCITDCTNAPCAQGTSCWLIDDASAACLDNCVEAADCGREGYVCLRMGQRRGACVPRCDLADVCEPWETCDVATGLCR